MQHLIESINILIEAIELKANGGNISSFLRTRAKVPYAFYRAKGANKPRYWDMFFFKLESEKEGIHWKLEDGQYTFIKQETSVPAMEIQSTKLSMFIERLGEITSVEKIESESLKPQEVFSGNHPVALIIRKMNNGRSQGIVDIDELSRGVDMKINTLVNRMFTDGDDEIDSEPSDKVQSVAPRPSNDQDSEMHPRVQKNLLVSKMNMASQRIERAIGSRKYWSHMKDSDEYKQAIKDVDELTFELRSIRDQLLKLDPEFQIPEYAMKFLLGPNSEPRVQNVKSQPSVPKSKMPKAKDFKEWVGRGRLEVFVPKLDEYGNIIDMGDLYTARELKNLPLETPLDVLVFDRDDSMIDSMMLMINRNGEIVNIPEDYFKDEPSSSEVTPSLVTTEPLMKSAPKPNVSLLNGYRLNPKWTGKPTKEAPYPVHVFDIDDFDLEGLEPWEVPNMPVMPESVFEMFQTAIKTMGQDPSSFGDNILNDYNQDNRSVRAEVPYEMAKRRHESEGPSNEFKMMLDLIDKLGDRFLRVKAFDGSYSSPDVSNFFVALDSLLSQMHTETVWSKMKNVFIDAFSKINDLKKRPLRYWSAEQMAQDNATSHRAYRFYVPFSQNYSELDSAYWMINDTPTLSLVGVQKRRERAVKEKDSVYTRNQMSKIRDIHKMVDFNYSMININFVRDIEKALETINLDTSMIDPNRYFSKPTLIDADDRREMMQSIAQAL